MIIWMFVSFSNTEKLHLNTIIPKIRLIRIDIITTSLSWYAVLIVIQRLFVCFTITIQRYPSFPFIRPVSMDWNNGNSLSVGYMCTNDLFKRGFICQCFSSVWLHVKILENIYYIQLAGTYRGVISSEMFLSVIK